MISFICTIEDLKPFNLWKDTRVSGGKDKNHRISSSIRSLFELILWLSKSLMSFTTTGLTCLWLEGNAIEKIENLDQQSKLCVLHLQENLISKIEHLDTCQELTTLNLSKNFISHVEYLSHLTKLTTLNLSHNNLTDAKSIEHITTLPNLQVLDLSCNKIEGNKSQDKHIVVQDEEGTDDGKYNVKENPQEMEDEEYKTVLQILQSCPSLKVLYLFGNEITKRIPHYRKTIIHHCRQLTYLDQRPVFQEERRRCNAWGDCLKAGFTMEDALCVERNEMDKMRKEIKLCEDENFRLLQDLMVGNEEEKDTLQEKDFPDNNVSVVSETATQ